MIDKVPDPLVKLDDKNLCNNLCKNSHKNLYNNLYKSLYIKIRYYALFY